MSREIKFRAWDKDLERYYYDAQNCYDFLTGLNAYCFGDLLSNDNYEIEQYTGLKDKNGKEIYEGDIVRTKNNLNGKMVSFAVGFEDGGFTPFIDRNPDVIDLDSPEVIGNVHQNK